jgi:hypothetical protein
LGFPWGQGVQIQRETKRDGVSHIMPLPFTLKKYLKAKKKKKNYGKLKYNFTHAKNIIFQKKMSLQEIKILQDILKLYN